MFAFLLTVCCLWLFDPPVLVAEGTASYYTRESGTLTASGEAFDENALTCAMREGAFGGLYLVAAEDGRNVVCRLNDRGPHARGRIIDLSKGAMNQLGATEEGLVHVRVYRIRLDFPPRFMDTVSMKKNEGT